MRWFVLIPLLTIAGVTVRLLVSHQLFQPDRRPASTLAEQAPALVADQQPSDSSQTAVNADSCLTTVADDPVVAAPNATSREDLQPAAVPPKLHSPKLAAMVVELLIRETELQIQLGTATDPAQRQALAAQITDVKNKRFDLYTNTETPE